MRWLKQSFTRHHRYDELSETIREHLDEKIADLMDRGMTREQAERAARREFGNVAHIEESSREVWQWPAMESFWADIKYALRQLRKSPAFSTVALLTLALGIGANTAIFSVVNSVLLRPLPFHDPARLMMLDEKWLPRFSHFEAPPQDFLAWREQSQSFRPGRCFCKYGVQLFRRRQIRNHLGARVTADLPDLLGVKPILGRSFTSQEDTAGNDHVILLGYSLWKRQFAGSPNVLRSIVKLNDVDFTVIGVICRQAARFPYDR